MKERPLLMSDEMVRAILDGRKTQTRRVVKPQPTRAGWNEGHFENGAYWNGWPTRCPYGQPGDTLWVRESFDGGNGDPIRYRADGGPAYNDNLRGLNSWRPSIHMPRWASRITLELTDVRVQRVQEISEADAKAEGVTHWPCGHPDCVGPNNEPGMHYGPRGAFSALWDSLNAKRGYSWASNPWVWALTFRPQTEEAGP